MMLKDKVVLISGMGPGMGVKMGLEAARQGAHALIISARTASKLDEAEEQISALGTSTQVLKVSCDITKPEDCKNLVAASVEKFGRIDCLVNSAYYGGDLTKSTEKADLDDWRKMLETNLLGTMSLTQVVVEQMKEQKNGAIVMVSSMAARKPFYGHAGYAASKNAMNAVIKYLAVDVGGYGIRVNAAAMGWMWGNSVESFFKYNEKKKGISVQDQYDKKAKDIPLGKIPTDDECGRAALFLISDMAAAITGVCLDVNGGEYMAA